MQTPPICIGTFSVSKNKKAASNPESSSILSPALTKCYEIYRTPYSININLFVNSDAEAGSFAKLTIPLIMENKKKQNFNSQWL
ncbi:hypothetical protein GCM10027170_36340 [Aliiglaciecola aliphaticivorans]